MKSTLKRLFSALSVIGAMMLVTEVILATVLYFGGFVTKQKVTDIVKVVQGELQTPSEEEVKEEAPQTPLEIKRSDQLEKAVALWEKEKKAQEEDIDTAKEAAESMRRELETVRAETDARRRELDSRIAAFNTQKATEIAAEKDARFQEAVKTYSQMEPKDVAELLYDLPDKDVVRYLKAFKTTLRAEILTEIKKVDKKEQPRVPGDGRMNRAAALQEILSGGYAEPPAETASAAATN
ncbi:MAG: hypothetical protein J7M19_01300 [Planctomycetes bacterium]|nr:hypothetical protein [Planctomycetota bacterium]